MTRLVAFISRPVFVSHRGGLPEVSSPRLCPPSISCWFRPVSSLSVSRNSRRLSTRSRSSPLLASEASPVLRTRLETLPSPPVGKLTLYLLERSVPSRTRFRTTSLCRIKRKKKTNKIKFYFRNKTGTRIF